MSGEERLNRIEDKLDAEILSSSEFRGELRQFMTNTNNYVKAVSDKAGAAQTAIITHEKDPDAHGAGIKKDIDSKVMGWAAVGATLISCFAGAIGAAVHRLWGHQ